MSLRQFLTGLMTIFVFFLVSCSGDDGGSAGSDPQAGYDLADNYESLNFAVSRTTGIEIQNSNGNLLDLYIILFREGLSVQERELFDHYGVSQNWADSFLGRKLILGNGSLDLTLRSQENSEEGSQIFITVCSQGQNSPLSGLSFIYCYEGSRQLGSQEISGFITVHAMRDGVSKRQTRFPLYARAKIRWGAQYLGQWSGKIDISTSLGEKLNIPSGDVFNVDIQPRDENFYFVKPLDSNRPIEFGNDKFVYFEDVRSFYELEQNTAPYINFVYRSVPRGEQEVRFNGHVRGPGRIEGNITLNRGGRRIQTLGTFVFTKN